MSLEGLLIVYLGHGLRWQLCPEERLACGRIGPTSCFSVGLAYTRIRVYVRRYRVPSRLHAGVSRYTYPGTYSFRIDLL